MIFVTHLDRSAELAAFATAALACALLARFAPRLGWVDGGSEPRKRGVAPLPLVGGAVLVAGLLAGWLCIELGGRDRALFVPGRALRELVAAQLGPGATLWPLGALLVAFVVGTIDDLLADGLRPALKLAGQAAAGFVLALPLVAAEPASAEAWGAAALSTLAACVALNLVNTFDNADGAAAGLGCAAFALPAPLFAAALAAFLPFNIARRGGRPRAILGDAGSHALGVLFLLVPAAWPALALPCLDLARLAWVRWRAGDAPWSGDRRHLAHRLEARGLAPWGVALALLAVSAPALLLGWPGVPLTALAFALALRMAPAPLERPVSAARGPSTAAVERS